MGLMKISMSTTKKSRLYKSTLRESVMVPFFMKVALHQRIQAKLTLF